MPLVHGFRPRLIGAVAGFVVATSAYASPSLWTGTQGNLSASVDFDTSGSELVVTLSNISLSDVLVPANVLTAVFFDIAGSPLSLTRVSAVVPAGHTVHFGPTDPGGVVGGEWAYNGGLSGAPGGLAYGISSAGFSLFGPGDRFPGNDLQPPASPDGLQYGITSAGDNVATGNTPVTGTNALIQSSVVFRLGGLPGGFDPLTSITAVRFQYGTDTGSEPNFPGVLVPAPGTGAALVLAGLLAARRRR